MITLIDGILGIVGGAIDQCGWADTAASKLMINTLVASAPTRPHPFSTASDYTSWKSLTDKTYQGRQLPAADLGTLPALDVIAALFQRPDGQQRMSDKSTCLFPAFAQYPTDGFIRTQTTPRNTAKTTSNHEIDLCALYGLTEAQTTALRLNDETFGQRGLLQSQIINGEEWSPWYMLRDGSPGPAVCRPG